MKQQPVSMAYPNAPAARAMLELAMVLEEDQREISPIDNSKGLTGLFSKIFRRQFRKS
jgi:MinD-like ATPase involved in chromosome partitioning or flagellar assembly